MSNIHASDHDDLRRDRRLHTPLPPITTASAVSWGAILAGATGAAALSLILLMLGTGLGLSAISPWSHEGVSASTLGASTIVWLALTQILASGMGGYLAGRLRTKWAAVHPDEVYFRDTAHGFLAWAVASLGTAALLGSAIGGLTSTGVQAGASTLSSVANTASMVASNTLNKSTDESSNGLAYFVDSLFRKDAILPQALPEFETSTQPTPHTASQDTSVPIAEVGRIFANAVSSGALPPQDVRYVGQLIATHTKLNQQDAEKRVVEAYTRATNTIQEAKTKAQEAADKARKTAAYTTLWMFISLLIGAFTASLCATFGGRQREA